VAEIVFGDTTTGSSNDIEKATNLARAMVTQYGMSEKLGPLTYGKKDEMIFLGREISEQRNYSDEVAAKIDAEARSSIAYQRWRRSRAARGARPTAALLIEGDEARVRIAFGASPASSTSGPTPKRLESDRGGDPHARAAEASEEARAATGVVRGRGSPFGSFRSAERWSYTRLRCARAPCAAIARV
jgi:cell division protease FtsH